MATTFTDKKGRVWDLALDLRKARIVDRSDFSLYWDKKFSILSPEKELIGKLVSDAPFLFAVIWAIVQDQAEEKWKVFQRAKEDYDCKGSISANASLHDYTFCPPRDCFPLSPREPLAEGEDTTPAELEFVSGVNGSVIEAARTAMIEALGDFFPEQRTALLALANQIKVMGRKVGEKLTEALPMLEEVLDEELTENLEEAKKVFRQKIREGRNGGRSSLSPHTQELVMPTSGQPVSLSSG